MADCAHQQTSRVDLSGLLSELVNHVEMLAHVVVASEDGLPVATSAGGVSASDAETLAAVSAAVTSTALATAGQFEAGAIHTVTVRMQRGQLTLLPTRGGSLALQTQSRCDVTWLINQTQPVLAALELPTRTASDSSHQKGVRCA